MPQTQPGDPVKDGSAKEEGTEYELALRECEPLDSPERENCIERAKAKHGRM
jgi:hypothetical protein